MMMMVSRIGLLMLWNSWIQLSLLNKSELNESLNECISEAGHGFYT
jgi:hypothetical protein